MSFEDFKRVILELGKLSVFFADLSGGEVFTHPQIDRFIEFAHEHLQHVIVLTNGTILRARHAEAIRQVVSAKGCFPIQVSLDAWDSAINSLTRCDSGLVLRNLYKLRELSANVVIAMVITQYNIRHIPASIRELTQFTRFFHLMPFLPVKVLRGRDATCQVGAKEMQNFWLEIQMLREELGLRITIPLEDDCARKGCASGAPCMAAFSSLVIDPNLNVRGCDRVVDITLGNLHNSNLSDIWRSQAATEILKLDVPLCQIDWSHSVCQ